MRVAMRFGRHKINLRPVDTDVVAWFTGADRVAGSDDLCFIDALSRWWRISRPAR